MRLPHQPVVARHVERDQGLDARVADVLELLVVGRVEVGLEGAQPRAAPVDRPHVREPGEVAVEAGPQLERIGGEDAVEVVDAQRLVRRLDLHLHVAVGAEPERLEAAALSPPSGRNTSLTPTIVLPSISLRLPFLPCASFSASAYVRLTRAPRTPARLEHGVGVGEVRLVEQEHGPGPRRDHQVAVAPQEAVAGRDPLGPPHAWRSGSGFSSMGGMERGTSCQPPASPKGLRCRGAAVRCRPPSRGRRRLPAVVREVDLLPAPRHSARRRPPRPGAPRSSRRRMRTGIGA